MGRHSTQAVTPRRPKDGAGLSDAEVDAAAERDAMRAFRRQVREQHGEAALRTLGDLARNAEGEAVRRGAAKDLLEIGYGKASEDRSAQAASGPSITVNVLRLSDPRQSVAEAVGDALDDANVQRALDFNPVRGEEEIT